MSAAIRVVLTDALEGLVAVITGRVHAASATRRNA
jgi:hypothetical protein